MQQSPLQIFAYLEKKEVTFGKQKLLLFFGGEQGIRTLEQGLARYTISNRAPSTDSDNSPFVIC